MNNGAPGVEAGRPVRRLLWPPRRRYASGRRTGEKSAAGDQFGILAPTVLVSGLDVKCEGNRGSKELVGVWDSCQLTGWMSE